MDRVSVKFMKEALVRDMILFLCEEHKMPLPDAMNIVYTSDTYRMLSEDDSFLFTQSPVYLNDC